MRLFFFLLLLSTALPVFAQGVGDVRHDLIKQVYHVNRDLTYRVDITKKTTLLSETAIQQGQQDSQNFYPSYEKVKVLAAYVTQPNGKRINVPKDNIYTRSVTSNLDAPDFDPEYETTVVFPQLVPGSQTTIKWQITEMEAPSLGFNIRSDINFEDATTQQIIKIIAPKDLTLHTNKRGGYHVSKTYTPSKQIITAILNHEPAHKLADHSVSVNDLAPVFLASTLDSWQEIGNDYWYYAHDKSEVTPAIKRLAKQIAGNKTGLDAAKALNDWVASNIQYVNIPLNGGTGFVPHTANQIVKNGFGDCKDHVTLLQALLKVYGIAAQQVLIGWDNSYRALPLWNPDQFNHVIIYLPKYHIYSNPTSATTPFGQLDKYLANKFVILIGKQSTLAHTPKNLANNNRYDLNANINLKRDGSLVAKGNLVMTDNTADFFRGMLRDSKDKLKSTANNMLAQTNTAGYGMIQPKSTDPLAKSMLATFSWHSPQAINMDSTLYFQVPTGIDFRDPHYLYTFINQELIDFPMILGAQNLAWQYTLHFPKEYRIVQMPKPVNAHNTAGDFQASYKIIDDTLRVTRVLTFNHNIYSPQQYVDLKTLIRTTVKDAEATIVLKKRSA